MLLSTAVCDVHESLDPGACPGCMPVRMVWQPVRRCGELQATHEQGLKWFNEALQLVPDGAASPADCRHLEEAAIAASQTPSKTCM